MLCPKDYDFLTYQRKSTELNQLTLKNYEQEAAVVLHLPQQIQPDRHKMSTIHLRRFYGALLFSDTDLNVKQL